MRVFWTGVAIGAALVLQTALSQLLPGQARVLDPFLLVLVYCALTGGELQGMLAGTAAGWVQDVHFGGEVAGISGLTKLVIGYAIGIGSTRFHLGEPAARLLVLFAATVMDALLFSQLAQVFEVPASRLGLAGILTRAAVNAAIGLAAYALLERRLLRQKTI